MNNNFKVSYGPKIDPEYCVNCKKCYDMCPMDIFGLDDNGQVVVAYPAECQLCCFCEVVCPEVAIDVVMPLNHLLDFGILPTQMDQKSRFLEE